MAPAAVEVRCARCGETLEVDQGTTEFACPGCATAQRLPPELMPPPLPRPRRAIPLSAASAAHDRVPCGGCGAVLSVSPGLKSSGCPICGASGRRPQASSRPDRLPAAYPVPPGQEVLEDPLSEATHAGLVHAERYKIPIRSEQSQGWHPNHSVYRDESLSSFREVKRVPIHGERAHEKSCNPLVHAEDSHIEPPRETTTRPSKNKSRIQSSRVEKVRVDFPSQAIPVLQAQGGSSDVSDNTNQSQGRFPSGTITRHGKQKTTAAPRIISKELLEPPNQATHEQQALGTSSDGVHADQVQVEPGSKTAAWNQKRKRSSKSAGGNRKRTGLMSSSRDGLQLRRINRLAKKPTVPMDAEPTQLLNSSPNENQSGHQDITRIIANMTPSLPPQQQVPQASYNELDYVDASTLPSSFNHGTLHAECITNRYSPTSSSWHEHEMPQEGSYGADVHPIPLQTTSQVTNGQHAHGLSSGENNLEEVDVEPHRKSTAVRGRHKKKGLMSSSNEAELLGVSSVSHPRAFSSQGKSTRPSQQATRRPRVVDSDFDSAEYLCQFSNSPASPIVSDRAEEEEEYDKEEEENFDETFVPSKQTIYPTADSLSRVDLKQIKNDDYTTLRHKNQYTMPNDATEDRFRTMFQQDTFHRIYESKPFAIHKYVNRSYLNKQTRYAGLYTRLRSAGLDEIVSLKCDYHEDIIRQFYATIFMSPDLATITWMTGSQRHFATKLQFEDALNLPHRAYVKIHLQPVLQTPAQVQFYDPAYVGFVPGKVAGLLPLPSVINRIIRATILPRSGNNDAIRGHAWNVIEHVMLGKKFDVMDLILRELASCKGDVGKRMYFAPYLMRLIIHVTGYNSILPCPHKQYKPEGDHQRDLRNRPLDRHSRQPEFEEKEEQQQERQQAPLHHGGSNPLFLDALHTGLANLVSRFDSIDRRLDSIDHKLDSIDHKLDSMDQNFNSLNQLFEHMHGWASEMQNVQGTILSRISNVDNRVSSIEESITYSRRRRTGPSSSDAPPPSS